MSTFFLESFFVRSLRRRAWGFGVFFYFLCVCVLSLLLLRWGKGKGGECFFFSSFLIMFISARMRVCWWRKLGDDDYYDDDE
jgi:hypothetical protein